MPARFDLVGSDHADERVPLPAGRQLERAIHEAIRPDDQASSSTVASFRRAPPPRISRRASLLRRGQAAALEQLDDAHARAEFVAGDLDAAA